MEAGYSRYHGEQGEMMASQIIRLNRDVVPQWAVGTVDLKANATYTDSVSLMYNGLTGITPWYFDRRTEWYGGLTFNTDPGYKRSYRNELAQQRLGVDVANTSQLFTDAGVFTLDYGLSFSG